MRWKNSPGEEKAWTYEGGVDIPKKDTHRTCQSQVHMAMEIPPGPWAFNCKHSIPVGVGPGGSFPAVHTVAILRQFAQIHFQVVIQPLESQDGVV